jgi:hypothetical protein
MQEYFPQGVAVDESFCNRSKEKKALRTSIESNEHLVLVAPRRHGKTSLLAKVLQENDFPGVSMDFFFVLTQAEVVKTISDGISKIITQLLPKSQKACKQLLNTVTALNPKLTFNFLGQKLEISTRQTTEKTISELLLALDQFAAKAKKSCVIIFDEFQQIGELKENHAVEAAIRHAVERSQYVSYIFCGSKRHLLNEMFSDKSRPLYHLCDLMTIERIDSAAYHDFINQRAKKKWKKLLSTDSLEEITHLTENHPYYVNALCRRLWHSDKLPDLAEVRTVWNDYVNQQGVWITDDLSRLSLNRRKVLTALAMQSTKEPQSQEFSGRVGLPPSTIKRCLEDLQKLDVIYLKPDGYYNVLDPAVAYFTRQHAAS